MYVQLMRWHTGHVTHCSITHMTHCSITAYCLQVYSSGTDVKQRGLHVVVLNQGNVSTMEMQCELLSVLGC